MIAVLFLLRFFREAGRHHSGMLPASVLNRNRQLAVASRE